MDSRSKILNLEQAEQMAQHLRAAGRRLVLTAGTFEVLHADHARFLNSLRGDSAALLAAVYGDAACCLKLGRPQPALDEQSRAQMVAALACVDFVLIWPEPELEALQQRLRPDRVEPLGSAEPDLAGAVLKRFK